MKSDAINYEGYDDGEYGFELASMLRAASDAQIFTDDDLAQIAAAYPVEVTICLKLLVGKISRDRYFFLDEKHVKEILNAALESKIQEAVEIAGAIQDDLLRHGRFEYKELAP